MIKEMLRFAVITAGIFIGGTVFFVLGCVVVPFIHYMVT